jgi:hypothetical protein
MKRSDPGQQGVIVYSHVPVRDVGGQRAYAYLHITGSSRTKPSHVIRAFLNDGSVDAATPPTTASFAGDFATYNSPHAPEPDPYEMQIDVSEALERIDATGRAGEVDVSLVLVDLDDAPLRDGNFEFDDMFITRRKT